MPTFTLAIFLIGCLGGLLPDILRLIKNRYNPTLPPYLSKSYFWIGLGLQVLVGGLTAWLFEAETAKYAVVFGYAAPQFLSQLVAGTLAKAQPVDRSVTTAESKASEQPMTIARWLAS